MTKITILFAILGLACCVNAQFLHPLGLFSELKSPLFDSKGFKDMLNPEYIKSLTPGKNGNVQGSYMESHSSYDSEKGSQHSSKVITNDNGDVKEYDSNN